MDKRLVVVFVLAALLLGWFVSGLQWEELGEALWAVKPEWLLAACVFMLIDYVFRAWRWMFIVRHVDRNVPFWVLWRATAIGAALNLFLPLRGGDLVKPALVSKHRKVPFTTLLSTSVVEKLLDAFGVVLALVVVLLVLPAEVFEDPRTLRKLQGWGWASGGFALVGLGFVLFLATRRARETMMWILAPWPGPVRMRAMRVFLQLTHGLEAAGDLTRLLPALLGTVLVWTAMVLGIWAGFMALDFPAGVAMAVFVGVALTASVSVPLAPGYVGLFQVAMEQSSRLWGVPEVTAEAEAFVLWFAYVIPIAVFGLFYARSEGRDLLRFRERALEQAEGDVEEAVPEEGLA